MLGKKKTNFWESGFAKTQIKSDKVTMPEMLFGYFIGPFGAMLSSGIFTSILQNYFTDVLKLDLAFLTTLQLVSTILIVAANLIVGQLIERTRCLAGKARPWILLSALTLSVSSVLMFIVPFEGTAKLIWIAVAYNLYYAVAYPIYNTANSTLVPVSTRDSEKRGVLASFTNVAGLGVMGAGSMVFPVLVSFALKENQHLWFLTMLAVAVFSALTIYLQYRYTRERVTEELADRKTETEQSGKGVPLKIQLKAVAAVIVVPLCNRFGKRLVCMIGMLAGCAGGVIALAGNGQIIPVAAGVALKCLGSAPACYMILAMLADVIDHIEYKTSIRTDGLTMSIYSSIMVAGTPICNAVFSSLLNLAGYRQNADVALGTMAQTAGVQNMITISYIGVETTAYLICAVLIFFFTVEKNLPQEQQAIADRKKMTEEGADK